MINKKEVKRIDKFSKTIPNPVGISSQDENSMILNEEHHRWRSEAIVKPVNEILECEYWERVSSCTVL